jgi:hypothetical protein
VTPSASPSQAARRGAAVVAFFTGLTALLAYPLSLEPATRAIALGDDTRLYLWTLGWDVHALLTRPLHLFDANIFFPYPNTLAYSENLVGSALVAAPVILATGNPLLAMNVVVLLSCLLSGVGAYLLARRLGLDVSGALATGIVFAFGPPRFARLGQVHLATVQWIPFSLAFLHSYAERGRRRDLLLACAFYTLQAITSGHAGLYLLLAGGGLTSYLAAFGLVSLRRMLRDVGLAGALILALNLPFLMPYFEARQDVGLRRSLETAASWTPSAGAFLAAPTNAQRAILALVPPLGRLTQGAHAYLFPGWLPLLLAAASLGARRRAPQRPHLIQVRSPRWLLALDGSVLVAGALGLASYAGAGLDVTSLGIPFRATGPRRVALAFALLALARLAVARARPLSFLPLLRRGRDRFRRWAEARAGVPVAFYALLAGFSLWASLGPRFGLYTLLYRFVPGFDLVRVPSRLTLLTLLALAVLAGAGLDRVLDQVRATRRVLAAAAILALLVAELAALPLQATPYGVDIPAVDLWLASQPLPFVVMELPVKGKGDPSRIDSYYMIHSMAHWQRIVNGYSGFAPSSQPRLYARLAAFPDEDGITELERLGVNYVVLHRRLYTRGSWRTVLGRLGPFAGRLRLVHRASDGRVYALGGRAPGP